MISRCICLPWLALVIALLLTVQACSHTRAIHVLEVAPQTAFQTLGMVAGQGENEATALDRVLEQAARIEADAVIVEGKKMLGRQMVITARAVRYLVPPPGE